MLKVLSAIAEQRLGYKFGRPQHIGKKSLSVVVPILRTTSLNRQYVSFPETDKVLVFDTGKIDEMEAENTSDENVFVRSGTLFRGETQERALQRSAVLFPHKKSRLNVRCVHATRGINPNAKTGYGGITPLAFDQQVYSKGYTPGDQSSYWASAKSTAQKFSSMTSKGMSAGAEPKAQPGANPSLRAQTFNANSSLYALHDDGITWGGGGLIGADSGLIGGTESVGADAFDAGPGMDNLAAHLDEFSVHFDDLLSKVKCEKDQAGIAILTEKGVETVEFFDHGLSWKALHEAAIKRVGSHLVGHDQEEVFEYKPEHAVKQINRILALDWETNRIYEHKPSNGEPSVLITGLSCDDFVGEAVELGNALIHLVLLKKAA
jgi:hypothetical protein